MSSCRSCSAELSDELEVCPVCNTARLVVTCERCGEEFEEADSCPACGKAREAFECRQHPENVADGRCVLCGKSLCRQCVASDNRAMLCEDHRHTTVIQGWAQVYSTASEFEARLLRDNLLAEGIHSQIYSQRDNMFSLEIGELSIVRLLVPAWEHEHASRVIREHMDEDGEVAFACPSCGEAYDPGAASCSACGAALAQGGVD
jgi:hypothetical protein